MKCHCCQGEYEKYKDLPDVYQCVDCKHIYRQFNGDIEEYHREQYRKEFKTYPPNERRGYCLNLLSFFKDSIDIDDEVLEIGCGDGYFSNMVSEYAGEVTAVEIDSKLTKQIEEKYPGLEIINDSFMDIDFEQTFDLVYSIDVLEHVEDVTSFVQNIQELEPKIVVIQVPTGRAIYNPNPKFDGHLHYFSKESLTKLFEGFKLLKFKVTGRGETARGPEMLAMFVNV